MFQTKEQNLRDFVRARYGLFIHYGLYSLLGRGEWCLNKEQIDIDEYRQLADRFTAETYDADEICRFAKAAGMRYVCLTTMHHDGFMLYDSDLTDFCAAKTACGRDLVAETVEAARKHGLRIHLYHSLNHWTCQPDAVAALENKQDYEAFIDFTFARIRELVTKYNPIDVLWYDGWWPFNAEGWKAEEMNAMVREKQPWILFNGRNGLSGDFTTPEGHMSAPSPWCPWEACMSLGTAWGYVKDDRNWTSPYQVVSNLLTAAKGNGNLLLNVGPKPDGSLPVEPRDTLLKVGDWLRGNSEAVFDTDVFDMGLMERGDHRSDWSHVCDYTASGKSVYVTVKFWPGERLVISGLEPRPRAVTKLDDGQAYDFEYGAETGRLVIHGLPKQEPGFRTVFKIECEGPPEIYKCGGMRTPNVAHPPYDPCPSDLQD
ncbi:MAG: alpha-L-fucosidase [Candidatus Pacebacteria bacterium]|nr:alpha-L-fucosidase [Candidatus Paceibacterota bacterium]